MAGSCVACVRLTWLSLPVSVLVCNDLCCLPRTCCGSRLPEPVWKLYLFSVCSEPIVSLMILFCLYDTFILILLLFSDCCIDILMMMMKWWLLWHIVMHSCYLTECWWVRWKLPSHCSYSPKHFIIYALIPTFWYIISVDEYILPMCRHSGDIEWVQTLPNWKLCCLLPVGGTIPLPCYLHSLLRDIYSIQVMQVHCWRRGQKFLMCIVVTYLFIHFRYRHFSISTFDCYCCKWKSILMPCSSGGSIIPFSLEAIHLFLLVLQYCCLLQCCWRVTSDACLETVLLFWYDSSS